jgi:hypothetical protein
MDVAFRLAGAEDDPDIRRLLAAAPLPGRIALALEREPDYFLGCTTLGSVCQVLVGREAATGHLVGVACRAVRRLYVNGEPREVGYLSQLRVDRRYRGRWLLSRGFQVFRALHADGRVRRYLTTITDDNHEARRLLVERPRRHFPRYRELERLVTFALVLRRRGAPAGRGLFGPIAVDPGDAVGFLEREGPARQFFPAYRKDDFDGSSLTRGFASTDWLAVGRAGTVAAVGGLWDQQAYKQAVVRGYAGPLRLLRPLASLALRALGAAALPPPGASVRGVYLAFHRVAGEDPAAFAALLDVACAEAARRGHAYLLVGLAARDPLLAVARRRLHVAYPSRLYSVSYEEDEAGDDAPDGRLPHVEIATL